MSRFSLSVTPICIMNFTLNGGFLDLKIILIHYNIDSFTCEVKEFST